ncbi:MAG TPA: hypothetical protein P5230_00590 [Candidatus Magasanikbacteria bacterium]|nr:hypothetical protein [Candidatus Magasanikbacteria bacterium]
MFVLIKSHFKDRFIFYSLVISFIFAALASGYIFGRIDWNLERLFLHYNIIFGVDRLGDTKDLWYFFAGIVGVFIFNYFFSLFLYTKDKVLSRTIMFFGGVWQIFMFIAVSFIVSLNS